VTRMATSSRSFRRSRAEQTTKTQEATSGHGLCIAGHLARRFIAGANAGPDNNRGDGGGRIHAWMYRVVAWRERQSLEDGKVDRDAELLEENYGRAGAFTFVTEGVGAAVKQASEHAGDGIVGVDGASVVRQCLDAGILDAVRVSLVPYLIGEGGSLLRRPGGDSGEAVAAEGGGGQARHSPHFEVER
jgi:hypothetical protein